MVVIIGIIMTVTIIILTTTATLVAVRVEVVLVAIMAIVVDHLEEDLLLRFQDLLTMLIGLVLQVLVLLAITMILVDTN